MKILRTLFDTLIVLPLEIVITLLIVLPYEIIEALLIGEQEPNHNIDYWVWQEHERELGRTNRKSLQEYEAKDMQDLQDKWFGD